MGNIDRRSFLRTLNSAILIPIIIGSTSGQKLTALHREKLPDGNPFAVDPPADIRDPLLVTIDGDQAYIRVEGFESVDRDTFVEHVLRLDPDVFDSMQLTELPIRKATPFGHHHTEIGLFARRYGFPHSNGVHEHMGADYINDNWYQYLDEKERWSHPDGTEVSHPEEIFAEAFDGSTRAPTTSIFADGARERLAQNGTEIFELCINRFWIDSVAYAFVPGLDYSDWAQQAFRNHLSNLDASTQEELGISEPEEFDIRVHLEDENLAPPTGNKPLDDEIFREFRLFLLERERQFVNTLFETINNNRPDQLKQQGTTTFGLGFELQGHQLAPSAITVVDDLDIVSIETQPTVPPDRAHDITTKIGRAAGRFEKPVRVWGKMTTLFESTYDLDPTEMHPTLMKIQTAMVYAHGGVRGIELPSLADHDDPGPDSLITWMDDDGSIPDTLHGFADFIRAHRSLLSKRETANDAVIAVSLPTLIWQRLPDWGVGRPLHTKAVSGAADLLRREQIPYDVQILDHPRIWEAPDQIEALLEYDLIVLPEVESITDYQADTIQQALEEGSTVIATGGGPTRDEQYQPRDDVTSAIESSGNGVLLDSNPTTDQSESGSSTFRNALPEEKRKVTLSVDMDISVNLLSLEEPKRTIIHLVNFTYDREDDTTESVSEFELRIRDLPFTPEAATYHRQSGIQSISIDSDGSDCILEVPSLDVWGFVVLSASEETMPSDHTEAEALEALEMAESLVNDARAAGRTELLQRAEAKIETLDPLLVYDAYDEIVNQSKSISEWIERVHRPPTIGLSQVHSGPELDFDRLRALVDEFEYQTVTDWDSVTLDEIDVLVVAAGDEHDVVSFDFSSSELEQVETFVGEGGSLLLLGRWDMDRTMNDLSSKFNIEFSQYAAQEAANVTRYRVRSIQSELTDQIPKWDADFGVTLKETDDVTELAWVASEQDTWLANEDTGEHEEDDATGLPVMAATEHGDGSVVAIGHANQFVSPIEGSPGLSSFAQNMFWKLGERAFRKQIEDDPADETDDDNKTVDDGTADDDEVNDDDEASDSVPGFGIAGAITGIGGAAYVLKNRLSDHKTEST